MDGKGSFGRETNVLAAIVEWVEKGLAPVTMEGRQDGITALVGGRDFGKGGGAFRRRHCR